MRHWQWGRKPLPQVLLLIAGRHKRVFWKYSSIGYALELKDVGVLFQTWYLMATAMGLGGCALGSGHSDLLGELNGTPWEEESAIGEFALGSIPKDNLKSEMI